MSKEQIATWYETINDDGVMDEISKSIIPTMETLASEVDSLTSDQRDEVAGQINSIASELVASKDRFMAATVVNQLITVFSNTDKVDEIIVQALGVIGGWSSNESVSTREVAINAVGQVVTNLSGLGKITTPIYAEQIFTMFYSAVQDAESAVKNGASRILGGLVEVLVGAFGQAENIDSYITQLYGAISSLVGDSSDSVRSSAASAMLRVIGKLAETNKLGAYAEKTFDVLTSLKSDSNSSVRTASIEILGPLLISISAMPVYQAQTNWILNILNDLASDDYVGTRDKAIEALEQAVGWIGDGNVATLVGIAKFETLVDLDLLNYANSDVQDAVISSLPDKLEEYNTRFDESSAATPDGSIDEDFTEMAVLVNNLGVITGLLAAVTRVDATDADALQAAITSAAETLNKIKDKIVGGEISSFTFYNIVQWIHSNFDSISSYSSDATEEFFQSVCDAVVARSYITATEADFVVKCIDVGYDRSGSSYIGDIATAFWNQVASYKNLSTADQALQIDVYTNMLDKLSADVAALDVELAVNILNQMVALFSGQENEAVVMAQIFAVINSWSSNADSDQQRQEAIDAAAKIAINLQSLETMDAAYATQILEFLDNAVQDASADVRAQGASSLESIAQALIGAFAATEEIDTYIDAAYSAVNNFAADLVDDVRVAVANSMLGIVNLVVANDKIGDYAESTMTVVNSFAGDANAEVRSMSAQILQPVAISLSLIEGRQDQTDEALSLLNDLVVDSDADAREKAVSALQVSIVSVDVSYVSTLVTIANFETITNLDLQNYGDPDIESAVIDSIPEKLTAYQTRIDSDPLVITRNLGAVKSLLLIIGTESEDDADNVKAAAASAKAALTKIVDNLDDDIMAWVYANFKSLAELSYTPVFLEDALKQKMTGVITETDIKIALRCQGAEYDFIGSVYADSYTIIGYTVPEEQVVEEEDQSVIGDVVDGLI